MSNGYLLATKIVERLSGDNQEQCLMALKVATETQTKGTSNDWNEALRLSTQAHNVFARIPEAHPLLGQMKTYIAAASLNLGKLSDAKTFAEEAVSLLQGVNDLPHTVAQANMVL